MLENHMVLGDYYDRHEAVALDEDGYPLEVSVCARCGAEDLDENMGRLDGEDCCEQCMEEHEEEADD